MMEEEVTLKALVSDPRGGFWGISDNMWSGPQSLRIYYHP